MTLSILVIENYRKDRPVSFWKFIDQKDENHTSDITFVFYFTKGGKVKGFLKTLSGNDFSSFPQDKYGPPFILSQYVPYEGLYSPFT